MGETTLTICLNDVDGAKTFVSKAEKFTSDVDLISGRYIVNGKSILGVLSLALTQPMDAQLHSDDPEEIRQFTEAIKDFIV